LRQSAQQVELEPEWKQEVSRRIAEHKGRKSASISGKQESVESQHRTGSRAAAAAARVAARYAKAPSYSEMLADEARAAVRAAEAASRAALEAQAVAESVLAGLEARSSATEAWEADLFPASDPEFGREPDSLPNPNNFPGVQAQPAPPRPVLKRERPRRVHAPSATPQAGFEILWDTDLPVRDTSPAPGRASRGSAVFEAPVRDGWDHSHHLPTQLEAEGFEVVEPAQPIHANLIEFPRELVATRKARPRRAEGPYAASVEAEGQLSIFEVDPGSISIDVPAGASAEAAASTFIGPKWSGIELDEEPQQEEIALPAAAPAAAEEAHPAAAAAALELAPAHQRLMAALVDFSLISTGFLAAAFLASANIKALPPVREIEIGSAVAWALIAVLYQAVFCTLAKATPGMKYARLELRTFAGQRPARAQRSARMAGLLLSLIPAGLGVAWSIFDEQHLCWHDRLSRTYPRKA
jgi:uncharacterized RDD family membrane protein YckC